LYEIALVDDDIAGEMP